MKESDQIILSLLNDQISLPEVTNREDMERLLTEQLVYLMLHRMEYLLSVLYRIDVSEAKTKAAFAQNDPKRIAPELCRLILERLEQKAETRIRYRSKDAPNDIL